MARFFVRQGLAQELDVIRGRGGELFMSGLGDTLYVAILSARERKAGGVFDGFDFGNCREFCREARWAMRLARELGGCAELFENPVEAKQAGQNSRNDVQTGL